MARATLINPTTGQREAIEIGSPREKQLFSQGFKLETKLPTGSLEGTLTGSLGTRELPEETRGGLENFKGIMRLIQSDIQRRRPSPMDILKRFDEAGVPLSTASQVSGVSLAEAGQRAADIEAQTKTFVGLITEQEDNNRRFQDQIVRALPVEVMQVMIREGTIGDLQELRKGYTPDSLLKAMTVIPPISTGGRRRGDVTPPPPEPIQLTPSQKNRIIALRADRFSTEVQNVLLQLFSPSEQEEFMSMYFEETEKRKQSIDPKLFLEQFAADLDSMKEESGPINPFRQKK